MEFISSHWQVLVSVASVFIAVVSMSLRKKAVVAGSEKSFLDNMHHAHLDAIRNAELAAQAEIRRLNDVHGDQP